MKTFLHPIALVLLINQLPAPASENDFEKSSNATDSTQTSEWTDTPIQVVDVQFSQGHGHANLGQLQAHTKYRIRFAIENHTPRPLTVSRVETSCGCMEERSRADAISPGDAGRLDILYTTPGLAGRIAKSTIIRFGDEPSSRYRIDITGTIAPKFQVSPQILEFSRESIKTGITCRFHHLATGDPPDDLRVEGLKGTLKLQNLEQVSENEWEATVLPIVKDPLTVAHDEVLRFVQSGSNKPVLADVRVRVSFPAAFAITPSRILARANPNSETYDFLMFVVGEHSLLKNLSFGSDADENPSKASIVNVRPISRGAVFTAVVPANRFKGNSVVLPVTIDKHPELDTEVTIIRAN